MEAMQRKSQKDIALDQIEAVDSTTEQWRLDALEGLEYLNVNMGMRLTAYIIGAETIDEIEAIRNNPEQITRCTAKKVQAVKCVFTSLMEGDGPNVARDWFISEQPELGDEAPAEVFKNTDEDHLNATFSDVWVSANHFLGKSVN